VTTVRAPLRITFGGGGSDLTPGRGICIAASINHYVTVTVSPHWDAEYVLHYAEHERWDHADQIGHRILRSVLTGMDVRPGVQISSMSDVPGGTGLGNSGAFTVALIHALQPDISRPHLAHLSTLHDIGQQDQWSATYGGFNIYDFKAGTIRPVHTTLTGDDFALYYTGLRHDAADILTGPAKNVPAARQQVAEMLAALECGDIAYVGQQFNYQWTVKLNAAPTVAHQTINQQIRHGLTHGAYGGKLVGAGDGGFLLFAVHDITSLNSAMRELGLRRLPFKFTWEGARCV
jgi:D-glycero-alpha-D-manno-heptose-7-phosphate kinase